jgi:hypothetical protein
MEKEPLQYKRPGCKIIYCCSWDIQVWEVGVEYSKRGAMVACKLIDRSLGAGIILKRECVEMAAVMLPWRHTAAMLPKYNIEMPRAAFDSVQGLLTGLDGTGGENNSHTYTSHSTFNFIIFVLTLHHSFIWGSHFIMWWNLGVKHADVFNIDCRKEKLNCVLHGCWLASASPSGVTYCDAYVPLWHNAICNSPDSLPVHSQPIVHYCRRIASCIPSGMYYISDATLQKVSK